MRAIQGFLTVSGGCSVMRAVRLTAFSLFFPAVFAGLAFSQQPQNVPDAPAPQSSASRNQTAPPNAPAPQNQPLPDLKNQVAPGKGTTPDQDGAAAAQPAPNIGSGTVGAQEQAPPPNSVQPGPPATGAPGQEPVAPPEGPQTQAPTIGVTVTYVDVPVTVRDKHGKEVPGLPWWRFRIYEDGRPQRIAWFTTDAYPLSIAFVVDATLPSDIMSKVNRSFSEVNNALTPADTVAIVSYGGTFYHRGAMPAMEMDKHDEWTSIISWKFRSEPGGEISVMDRYGELPPFTPAGAKSLRKRWLAAQRQKTSFVIGPTVLDVVGRKRR